MSKIILSNPVLKTRIKEAIDLLCNTVKVTLGPKGKNVIIITNYMNPFITNDGVTIAKEITSDDPVINAILDIAKEASIKTNNEVGDGTTTSLVLLQAIYSLGLEKVNSGYNPIVLKKELDEALAKVVNEIKSESFKIPIKDIYKVASLSANSEEIGCFIASVYQKIGSRGIISLEDSNSNFTSFEIVKGIEIDSELASSYMLKNTREDELKNCYLLITNESLEDINQINCLLNEIIEENKSLLIICPNMAEEVKQSLILNRHQSIIDVISVSLLSYGSDKEKLLNDIAVFSGGKYIDTNIGLSLNEVNINDLGYVKKVKVTKEKTIIINDQVNKEKISIRKKEIEKELLNCNQFEQETLDKRLASFNKGVAIIKVGANSNTELIEKKMRIIDAISSSKAALNGGVTLGGGLTYLKVINKLKSDTLGMDLLKRSLKEPFNTLVENIGLHSEEIFNNIKNSNYEVGYNFLTEEYVDMYSLGIIEPVKLTINALVNACSIASMLLTTENIIVNSEEQRGMNEEIDKVI